jgi:hypothetical protein
MCLDCGCKLPDERHGDERHIIMQDLVDASAANSNSVDQTFHTFEETTKLVLEGKLQSKALQTAQKA